MLPSSSTSKVCALWRAGAGTSFAGRLLRDRHLTALGNKGTCQRTGIFVSLLFDPSHALPPCADPLSGRVFCFRLFAGQTLQEGPAGCRLARGRSGGHAGGGPKNLCGGVRRPGAGTASAFSKLTPQQLRGVFVNANAGSFPKGGNQVVHHHRIDYRNRCPRPRPSPTSANPWCTTRWKPGSRLPAPGTRTSPDRVFPQTARNRRRPGTCRHAQTQPDRINSSGPPSISTDSGTPPAVT